MGTKNTMVSERGHRNLLKIYEDYCLLSKEEFEKIILFIKGENNNGY